MAKKKKTPTTASTTNKSSSNKRPSSSTNQQPQQQQSHRPSSSLSSHDDHHEPLNMMHHQPPTTTTTTTPMTTTTAVEDTCCSTHHASPHNNDHANNNNNNNGHHNQVHYDTSSMKQYSNAINALSSSGDWTQTDDWLPMPNRVESFIRFDNLDIEPISASLLDLLNYSHEELCRVWNNHKSRFIHMYKTCTREEFRLNFDTQLEYAVENRDFLDMTITSEDLYDMFLVDMRMISSDLRREFFNYDEHRYRLFHLLSAALSNEWWDYDQKSNRSLYCLIDQNKTSQCAIFKVVRRYLVTKVLTLFITGFLTMALTRSEKNKQHNSVVMYGRLVGRERNRLDLTTEVAYNNVLRIYRRKFLVDDDTLDALYLAFFYNPTTVYYLAGVREKPCKYSISDQEGYEYAQKMRKSWVRSAGAVYWIREWLAAPCDSRDCSFHSVCIDLAGEYKMIGNEKFAHDDYTSAVEFYTRAISLISYDMYPDKVTYYSNRALCFAKMNDHASVIEDCNAALQLSPTHAKSLFRKALSYEANGDNELALLALTELMILGSLNKVAQQAFDRIKSKALIPKEVIVEHQQMKEQGNAKYKQGDFQNALELYSKAISVCPEDNIDLSVLYCNRAACHFQLADHQSCISDCTASIAIDPSYLRARVRRAMAYDREKLLIHAVNDLNVAKKIDENNTEVMLLHQNIRKRIEDLNEEAQVLRSGRLQEMSIALMTNQLDTIAESMSRTWFIHNKRKHQRIAKFWESLSEVQKDNICLITKPSVMEKIEKLNNFVEIAFYEAPIFLESPYFRKSIRASFEQGMKDGRVLLPPDIHYGPWLDGLTKDNLTALNSCAMFEYDSDLCKANRLASGFLQISNNGRDINYYCGGCNQYKPWYSFYRASIRRAERMCMYCKVGVPEKLSSHGYLDDVKHKIAIKRLQSIDRMYKDNTMIEDLAYQSAYIVYTSCLNVMYERLEKRCSKHFPSSVPSSQPNPIASMPKKELVHPQSPDKENPFQQQMKSMLEDMQLSLFSVLREKGCGFTNAIDSMKPDQTTGICANCHSTESDDSKLKRCSVCRSTFYCSVECQREDWQNHKALCYSAEKFDHFAHQLEKSIGSRDSLMAVLDTLMIMAEKNSFYRKLMAERNMVEQISAILGKYHDDEEVKRFAAKLLFYLSHTKRGRLDMKSHVHFIMGIASRWIESCKDQSSAPQNNHQEIPLSSMLLQTTLAVVSDDRLVVE